MVINTFSLLSSALILAPISEKMEAAPKVKNLSGAKNNRNWEPSHLLKQPTQEKWFKDRSSDNHESLSLMQLGGAEIASGTLLWKV